MDSFSFSRIFLSQVSFLSPYCVYSYCKKFGLIESFAFRERKRHSPTVFASISFIRSPGTDELKPKRLTPIGKGAIALIWKSDDPQKDCVSNANISMSEASDDIINTLNDDCLREIFGYLDRFDLCSTGHVCKRFREISTAVAESVHFNSIEHTDENANPLWKWEKYFRMFGTTIRAVDTCSAKLSDIFMVFLSKYCDNIIALDGRIWDKRTMVDLAPLFKSLHKLRLHLLYDDGSLHHVFQPNSNLESLDIYARGFKLSPVHLPKLKVLRLRSLIRQHNQSTAIQFFKLNRQIEKLTLSSKPKINIADLLEHLLDLQELEIESMTLFCKNFSIFGSFHRLHTLNLKGILNDAIEMILQPIIHNGIQVKRLTLGNKRHPIEGICKMSSIEYLEIGGVNDAHLARIGANVPNWKEIDLYASNITAKGMLDLVKKSTNLAKASFEMEWLKDFGQYTIDRFDAIASFCTNNNIDINLKLNIKEGYFNNNPVSLFIENISFDGAPIEIVYNSFLLFIQGLREALFRHSGWVNVRYF